MSALAGIWHFDGRPDTARACARMLSAQAIYGPHDDAQWDMGTICVGRRLFRTLPEDSQDRQPLSGGGGRFVLVADLRLDNRDELIAALQLEGGLADSAVLLAAWERWQDAVFEHLVGDYAFALFDRNEQRLVLARDPLGMKPLNYHKGGASFAFASMPKGLHALPEIPREPDEERVAEHLALLPETGAATFFKNVSRVEVGCCMSVTRQGLTIRQHWQPQRKQLRLANRNEYAEGLRHHLDQAVRARLRGAGAAVAAHLSSGFDSSAVATSAATLLAPLGGKVVAFTSVPREGFNGATPRLRHGDEGPIAAKTAALYPNMEHVLIRPDGRSPLDGMDRNFFIYERPVLNLCNAVWMHAINDAVRERKIGVLLTGQMGNMSISHDGLTLLSELVGSGRMLRWFKEGSALVRNGHLRVRNLMVQSFGPYMPAPLWSGINRIFRGVDSGVGAYAALRPGRFAELDLAGKARERGLDLHYRPRRDSFAARLWVLRRVDLGPSTKGVLGGWGIDQRDPTADTRLIEYCLSVPDEQFLADGETKALARLAFSGRMPSEVLNMRGKGYQAADWYEGLAMAKGALTAEINRLDDCGPAATALDLPRLRELLENWPESGWETVAVMQTYRSLLLRAVSAGDFLRRSSGTNA